MSKVPEITGDATTQVITLEQEDQAIAIYPSMVPGLMAQLMSAAVALGANLNYPLTLHNNPITFKKGN